MELLILFSVIRWTCIYVILEVLGLKCWGRKWWIAMIAFNIALNFS